MGLLERTCVPCRAGTPPLDDRQAEELLTQLRGWTRAAEGKELRRLFTFDSYWESVGFVQAVAWIAQSEKHHPDIELGYKKVLVRYSTHAIGGLSENDFICAAKVNALFR